MTYQWPQKLLIESEKSKILKNFCALPFHHVMIGTNGDFNICCTHKVPSQQTVNINEHDHDHWAQSDYVKEVRESFSKDQRHPGCKSCWKQEDMGFESLRQRVASEYEILCKSTDRVLKNIEIDLGNLCNLRCLMCHEAESSAILAENVKLGINKITQADLTWSDLAYANLKKLFDKEPYVINIRGGEPLYNKKLLEIVEDLPSSQSKHMMLHITTNGTHWNQRWHDALQKFRIVRFMFSIDATGDLYEYIRYPASWTGVEKNVESMMSLPNATCLVHAVIQNLNVSTLGSLVQWCQTRGLFLDLVALSNPNHMQIQNLPDTQKNQAIDHLDLLLDSTLPSHLQKFIHAVRLQLQTSKFDPNMWLTFKHNISMRDNLRNNSFRKFIKED